MIVLGPEKVELKEAKGKGMGVYAVSNIEEGEVVADYLGTIYDLNGELPKYPGLYDMWLYQDLTICPDITIKGAQLINHSCEPNCVMYPYKGHILIVTLRPIIPGEELTYHYWCSPDSEHLPCKCGALKCRGTWLVSDAECDSYCEYAERVNKRYLVSVKVGDKITPFKNYKKIIVNLQELRKLMTEEINH